MRFSRDSPLGGDHSIIRQLLDLLVRVAEVSQQIRCVLTDLRRVAAEAEVVPAHLQRDPRQFGGHTCGEDGLEQTQPVVELRIVIEILGSRNR